MLPIEGIADRSAASSVDIRAGRRDYFAEPAYAAGPGARNEGGCFGCPQHLPRPVDWSGDRIVGKIGHLILKVSVPRLYLLVINQLCGLKHFKLVPVQRLGLAFEQAALPGSISQGEYSE